MLKPINKIRIWDELLKEEFAQKYMDELKSFIRNERLSKTIYPKNEEIFSAFDLTPFEDIKVVIIGQDPHITKDHAHGLSFSVREGCKITPTLKNIYKEIGIEKCDNGCLKWWAVQGVFLLNNVLTVEENRVRSHYGRGWEEFTKKVVDIIDKNTQHTVFMLWGNEAKKIGKIINKDKHLVLETSHPSPNSVNKGFFGCKHFDIANAYLLLTNQNPINWKKVDNNPQSLY